MNKTVNVMKRLTTKWPMRARAVQALCAAAWLMTLTSWTGCQSPKVIAADQVALRVEAARPFAAHCDGWFLSDALYQRTRRAVADRILELQTNPARTNR
jgi:hypothetical protein